MFALVFRFPAGRYHATPWGRNVNEADVAWPPEPWRLLRTLIAAYWRKCDHERWPEEHLSRLIDALAETLPVYRLPEGAIHAHTRHYMPIGTIEKGREKTSLVFDAFVRLPEGGTVVAAWRDATLEDDLFAFAADLAAAIGYLGRAESWAECEAVTDWRGEANCSPVGTGDSGDPVRLLAPLAPATYAAERRRLIEDARERIRMTAKKPPPPKKLEAEVAKTFRSKRSGMDTLPEHLVDALDLDTADYQDRGWSRPPAAREVVYAREANAAAGVMPRRVSARRRGSGSGSNPLPTVARFLLAGRPRPRVEDTVRIGELMRLAALSQFGWRYDSAEGRKIPRAPWQISGRDADGNRLKDPLHAHAFWLPEDADSDGLIDHVSVFIASGIDDVVCAKLDRITRLWLPSERRTEDVDAEDASAKEWRLALEGFGQPTDFAEDAYIFGASTTWQSITPFLASGHLKPAQVTKRDLRTSGHAREFRRLITRRGLDVQFGFDVADVLVTEKHEMSSGGVVRRTVHFHRFRSRGRETQLDAAGTFLNVTFPRPVQGPIALGYGSHFGLGLFRH